MLDDRSHFEWLSQCDRQRRMRHDETDGRAQEHRSGVAKVRAINSAYLDVPKAWGRFVDAEHHIARTSCRRTNDALKGINRPRGSRRRTLTSPGRQGSRLT